MFGGDYRTHQPKSIDYEYMVVGTNKHDKLTKEDTPMNLSQATSPEETKRELKQQVFLAIQGKYDTRQTSQLVEDIDTITNALIASVGVPKSLQGNNPNSKPFLFFGGDMDGQSRNFDCDDTGMPLAAIAYPTGSNDTYNRHNLAVGIDGKSKIYYFYSPKDKYKTLSMKSVSDTLSKIVEFYNRDDGKATPPPKPMQRFG